MPFYLYILGQKPIHKVTNPQKHLYYEENKKIKIKVKRFSIHNPWCLSAISEPYKTNNLESKVGNSLK